MNPKWASNSDDPGGGGRVNLAAVDMDFEGPYSTPSSPAHKAWANQVTSHYTCFNHESAGFFFFFFQM